MKKIRGYIRGAVWAVILSAGLSLTAFGGEWKEKEEGWSYLKDDGNWLVSDWLTEADGKSYYFNEYGYMLTNTTTPDGQRVGLDGAKIDPIASLPSSKGDVYYRGLRQALDSILLYPQESTGYENLDTMLDQIFAQIITADMDTHDKLKACYDYLIVNTEYGSNSYFGNSYRNAYGVFAEGQGVCDDYSAAFAVMARKIGVPVYLMTGSTHKADGGFTPHTWCQLDCSGITYIFDPQVDDAIAGRRNGEVMYIRFGGTVQQLADKYSDAVLKDDFSSPVDRQSSTITNDNWDDEYWETDEDFMDAEEWAEFFRSLFLQ